jgi:hypothetical protein
MFIFGANVKDPFVVLFSTQISKDFRAGIFGVIKNLKIDMLEAWLKYRVPAS